MAEPEVVSFDDYLRTGVTLQEGNFAVDSLLAAGAFGANSFHTCSLRSGLTSASPVKSRSTPEYPQKLHM